jgi:hypothetical protein
MSRYSNKRRRVPRPYRRTRTDVLAAQTAFLLCLVCLSLTTLAGGLPLEEPSTTKKNTPTIPIQKKEASTLTTQNAAAATASATTTTQYPSRSIYKGEDPPRPATLTKNPKSPSVTPMQHEHPPAPAAPIPILSVPKGAPVPKSASIPTHVQKKYEGEFILWCEQVLGIYTILEIQTFEYYDYMQALPNDDDFDDWASPDNSEDDDRITVEELPLIPVRGLAAGRDIDKGEVVIRIPFQALLTVSTTIDQDPVLSRVLGPEARQAHGWIADGTDESVYLLEMPLLAVALLHHQKLGATSPLSAYIRVLESSDIDSMPFLWPNEKLKEASPGVRTVARGIQQEIRDMYDSVVQVLIREHPDLFGPVTNSNINTVTSEEKKWMFSFEHFQWAFAMVNSRHWQLPISDLERPEGAGSVGISKEAVDEQNPPADMPTDIWTQEHGDAIGGKEKKAANSHSFLAPVADLLNFGPPCTTGRYNAESHTFEIVASCSFSKGQEVTFWYSDECDDIIAGSYGFTHPMVPKCPTADDWRITSQEWKEKAELMEEQLSEAYEDLNHLYAELEHAQAILDGCDCCRYEKRAPNSKRREAAAQEPSYRLRHEPSVRGAKAPSTSRDDIERHGVRRMWRDQRDQKLEF